MQSRIVLPHKVPKTNLILFRCQLQPFFFVLVVKKFCEMQYGRKVNFQTFHIPIKLLLKITLYFLRGKDTEYFRDGKPKGEKNAISSAKKFILIHKTDGIG